MGKAGSPVCWYVDYTCYIFLDLEEREECNDIKIIFIALSMKKLLTRRVRPTQCEQTIGFLPKITPDTHTGNTVPGFHNQLPKDGDKITWGEKSNRYTRTPRS